MQVFSSREVALRELWLASNQYWKMHRRSIRDCRYLFKLLFVLIWIVKRSLPAVKHLLEAMEKKELRQGRYRIIALDQAMVEEMCGLLAPRNEVLWVSGTWEPPHLQFDFNGLWFDAAFSVLKF